MTLRQALELQRLFQGVENRNDSGWVDADGVLHLTLRESLPDVARSSLQGQALSVGVDRAVDEAIKTAPRSRVEMEALTAATVAALTVYDMMKWADKAITISAVKLLSKSGGKSGDFKRPS